MKCSGEELLKPLDVAGNSPLHGTASLGFFHDSFWLMTGLSRQAGRQQKPWYCYESEVGHVFQASQPEPWRSKVFHTGEMKVALELVNHLDLEGLALIQSMNQMKQDA